MPSLILPSRAPIRRYLESWERASPGFLWIPDSDKNLLVDQASGIAGDVIGDGTILTNGGLFNPAANGGQSLHFPTKADIVTTSAGRFAIAALVSVPSNSNTGAFFKIGDGSTGIGVGTGNTTFENAGTKLIGLREGLAWQVSTTSPITTGLRLITVIFTTQNARIISDYISGASVSLTSTINNATPDIFINGYLPGRGSNCVTHALAVFNTSLTNAQSNEFFNPLVTEYNALRQLYGADARPAFYTKPRVFYFDSAGSGTGGSDATGTGTPHSVALTPPPGYASGSAVVGTAPDQIHLSAPTASATGTTAAHGTATCTFDGIDLTSPSGSAAGSAAVTCDIGILDLGSPAGSATGSATITSALPSIAISAVAGSATGTTAGNAAAVGGPSQSNLAAPTAAASGSAVAFGSFDVLSLSAPSGAASAYTGVMATGSLPALAVFAPSGNATGSATANPHLAGIPLTAPTGSASVPSGYLNVPRFSTAYPARNTSATYPTRNTTATYPVN